MRLILGLAMVVAVGQAAGAHVAWAQAASPASAPYDATIRRTSYGIPHITARDFGSLGFGEGYAAAEDHFCSLADQIVRAHGQRARYFGAGPGDAHLNSDLAMKALDVAGLGANDVRAMPTDFRAWMAGYAAGANAWLAKVTPANVPGWCRGEPWVRPVTAEDIGARMRLIMMTLPAFAALMATAAPPGTSTAPAADGVMPDFDSMGSNGWAIGRDRSATGRGMLVANPHYPWVGSNRFWEKHLTIPGILDVYGVSLLGTPGVAIGFNRHIAWTHTVSAGARMTAYRLSLVPGDPTSYLYDGKPRKMIARPVDVEVRQTDGTIQNVRRTLYFSHHGPVVNLPGLPWTTTRAIAVRDANAANDRGSRTWLTIGQATTLDAVRAAHGDPGGVPFINTMAASADGRALYIDGSSAPLLSPETIAWWRANVGTAEDVKTAFGRNLILLDGSNPQHEWVVDARASLPGNVPLALMPQLERTDYVFNANDSYWLSHPRAPLTGYSPVHGGEETPRSLRTRMNIRLLDDTSPTGPSGADGKFSLDELAAAALSNRSMSAELLRGPLVTRCQATSMVTLEGRAIDLSPACRTLAAWDGTLDLDRRGAVLWREFITQFAGPDFQRAGTLFATDFAIADPVNTPRELAADPAAPGNAASPLAALGRAVVALERAGLAVDVPLGDLQHAMRGGRRVPIHGGLGGQEGVANVVSTTRNDTTLEPDPPQGEAVAGSRLLRRDGYPITFGTSFIMALAFTDAGPQARAFLTYGQTGDPQSPHFGDQTDLFSRKAWRPILFTEDQIRGDAALKTMVVTGARAAVSR